MLRSKQIYLFVAVALSIFALAGCDLSRGEAPNAAAAAEVAALGTVDSIFPIEEEIRRFSEAVGREATELDGGAPSRDDLVARYIDALERADTAALAGALVDAAEFIHLYFPHTVYVAPPYQMDPAIIWFQMGNQSGRGLGRALQRYAGRDLGYDGYRCAPEPVVEGPNRVWDRCVVRIAAGDAVEEVRLFGMILERDGHYKFITYGNSL